MPSTPSNRDHDPDLDKTLTEFLVDHKEDKRKGFTLANLFTEWNEFRKEQRKWIRRIEDVEGREVDRDERVEEAHDRLDAHRNAIVQVKRRMRNVAAVDDGTEFDKEMDTGNFDLVAIQREVTEQKTRRLNSERVKSEEIQWWKRSIIMWTVGGFGAVATIAITILITLAIRGK